MNSMHQLLNGGDGGGDGDGGVDNDDGGYDDNGSG